MEANHIRSLMLRWSIVSVALTALFWGVWYFVTGNIPVLTEVTMTEGWTLELPFVIPRWWDILAAPLLASAIILVVSRALSVSDKETHENAFGGLLFGLIFGLIFGLGFGLVAGLIAGLFVGFVLGVLLGAGEALVFILAHEMFIGIAIGLAFGLALGLPLGLAIVLVFGLGFEIFLISIRYITNRQTCQAAKNWLLDT